MVWEARTETVRRGHGYEEQSLWEGTVTVGRWSLQTSVFSMSRNRHHDQEHLPWAGTVTVCRNSHHGQEQLLWVGTVTVNSDSLWLETPIVGRNSHHGQEQSVYAGTDTLGSYSQCGQLVTVSVHRKSHYEQAPRAWAGIVGISINSVGSYLQSVWAETVTVEG